MYQFREVKDLLRDENSHSHRNGNRLLLCIRNFLVLNLSGYSFANIPEILKTIVVEIAVVSLLKVVESFALKESREEDLH